MPIPTENLTFTLRSTIFDRRRQLTISPDYLEFDDNDLAESLPTRFLRSEIESLRLRLQQNTPIAKVDRQKKGPADINQTAGSKGRPRPSPGERRPQRDPVGKKANATERQ